MFDFIIKVLSVSKFKDLLTARVIDAFKESFENTNAEFSFSSKVDPAAIEYLKNRQIILSEKTISNLVGNLKFELLEGLDNSESITDIRKRLDGCFKTGQVNTERIARTEIINSMNAGEFQSMTQSGVIKYKSWCATPGKRTADDSKRLHGQVQPINKPFIDPANGDECMHSPNRPNCRCSTRYYSEKPPTKIKNGMDYLE